tara:strand:- start:497 stop:1519 length:1023 start_codon:yes stop_codon:yes gene_type:complete
MYLEDFNYSLPRNLIAKRPKNTRKSKVLLCSKKKIINFEDILNELDKDDVLIFNNTKVMPSTIKGILNNKEIKLTLLNNFQSYCWRVFIKPAKKVKENIVIKFNNDLNCTVVNKKSVIAEVRFNHKYETVLNYLNKFGNLPLPPYIKSQSNRDLDEKYYQTVFAKKIGAVASPTAGLHFNENIMKDLKNKKIETIFTTLHVGAGTFLPLKNDNIKKNTLHKERGIISSEAAKKINTAISGKKRIIAVGTTVVRLLEACYCKYKTIKNFNEDINLFIYPGYKFKVIDKLITNFHLPKSSLLLLVSAFSSNVKIKEYYEFAIKNNMQFFSFGDAMFLDKDEF